MVAAKKATTLTLMYKKAQRRDDHLTSILAHPSVNKGDAFFVLFYVIFSKCHLTIITARILKWATKK